MNEQYRFQPYPFYKSKQFTVSRYLRTACTARTTGYCFNIPRLPVQSFNGVNAFVGVFVILEIRAGGNVLTPVNIFPIRRNCRFSRVLLIVFAFGKLDAVAAVLMVQPHLA